MSTPFFGKTFSFTPPRRQQPAGPDQLLLPGRSAFDCQFTTMASAPELGTFCHENGHMLCDYPDLYDYGGESGGVDYWCLMCAGNHANPKNPAGISAYLNRLSGWASSVTVLEHGKTLALEHGRNQFAMLAKNNEEYFLIENRQKLGRDAHLPGASLTIWHVDEQGNNSNELMSATSRYELSLKQADGLFQLEKSSSALGDAADLYTGPTARWADDSLPSSKWWDGTPSFLTLDQITPSDAPMRFRCSFSNVALPPTGVVRHESAPAKAIPDNHPAGVSDSLKVAEALTIADLKVGVEITHSCRGDLEVRLVAPWGDVMVLHPKGLGGSADHLRQAFDNSSTPALAHWRGRPAPGGWKCSTPQVWTPAHSTAGGWPSPPPQRRRRWCWKRRPASSSPTTRRPASNAAWSPPLPATLAARWMR